MTKNGYFEPSFPSILGFWTRFPDIQADYAPKKAKRRML